MKQLVEVKCPSCAAALPSSQPAREIVCRYCGMRFVAAPPSLPPQLMPPPGIFPDSTVPQHPRSAKSSGSWSVVAVLLLVAGAAGAAWFFLVAPGSFAELVRREDLWDSGGGRAVPATVDGSPVVVGRFHQIDGTHLYVAVYDVDPIRERWRTGELGTPALANGVVLFGVEGDRIVYSDWHSNITVAELATGTTIHTLTLSDRVKAICNPPGETGTLWLEKVDDRHVRLDVETLRIVEAEGPAGCAPTYPPDALVEKAAERAPKVEGLLAERLHVDAEIMIVAGHRSPGTALPRVVAFDSSGARVLWDVALASVDPATVRERSNEHDALVAGHYFASYGAGDKHSRVTALAAATGERLWDVELPAIGGAPAVSVIVATPEFVFVARGSTLEVLNAATGTFVGNIGTAMYE